MSIKAMKQALEALENHTAIKHPQQRHYRDEAIDALRAAIDQAEKPRQWQKLTDDEIHDCFHRLSLLSSLMEKNT